MLSLGVYVKRKDLVHNEAAPTKNQIGTSSIYLLRVSQLEGEAVSSREARSQQNVSEDYIVEGLWN